MQWHSLYLEEIYSRLRTGEAGLSADEAALRLKEHGPNEFREVRQKGVPGIVLNQFKGVFILILIAAGGIALALGDAPDAVLIFLVVGINTLLGFIQEYRAERTLQLLKRSLEERALVIRGNEEREILRREAVPGDIVVFERGRKIPADCRLIRAQNLLVNEAILTGEWLSAKKESGILPLETSLADRTNMLYMGTIVENGSGLAVAVETGERTEFGKIGERVQLSEKLKTPLEKSLARFSALLGVVISAIIGILFVFGVFRGIPVLQMFLSSVALAVAAVPEGLAISLTIILAVGMRRILRRKGLVRNLFAAETLGAVSVIATDKTGTLTEARMQVSHILTGTRELLRDGVRIAGLGGGGEESHLLALRFIAAASEAVIENPEAALEEWRIRGRPTDRALVEAALEAGIRRDEMLKRGEILDTLPFDERRKFSAAILRGRERNTLAVVGAPEIILAHSQTLHIDGHTASLKSENFQKLNERYLELVRLGLRVIAVGHKDTKAERIKENAPRMLQGLALVGLVAMRDPVRKGVREEMEASREAGIKTVIVTGDHAFTARAIARDVGLEIPEGAILEGGELAKLNDAELRERARKILLFARTSPEHKFRIVESYQAGGEAVAVVGDGINDAPAIRRADIGIALGSGTDLAKDAADLVLLDDSFATIVAAIREGRTILENIRKTIVYLLAPGFTEVIVVGLSILSGLPLPLLPAQILWINLVQEGFPALSLAFEKSNPRLMSQKPDKKSRIFDAPILTMVAVFGAVTSASVFLLFWWLYSAGWPLGYARTMVFAFIIVSSLLYIFSVKNLRRGLRQARFFDNGFLMAAVLSSFALFAASLYIPFLRGLLDTVPLSALDWSVVLAFGIFNVLLAEALKYAFLLPRKRAVQ